MPERKFYFCDNPKCRKHVLVKRGSYNTTKPEYNEYVGEFETLIEENYEYITKEGEFLNFCSSCKMAIEMIKED